MRICIIPLLCQGLLCGVAEAQRNKEDADTKREQAQKQRQQAQQQAQRKQQQAQQARQNQQAQQKKQAQQQAQRKQQQQAQQARQNQQAQQKKQAQQQAQRKQQQQAQQPRQNQQAQQKKQAQQQARQNQQAQQKKQAQQQAQRKQQQAQQARQNQQAQQKKQAQRKQQPEGPQARQNQQARQKQQAQRQAQQRQQAKRAERMNLPGNRPNVKPAERREQLERQRLRARRQAAASNTRIAQNRPRGVVRPGQNTRQIRRAEFRDRDRAWWASGGRRDVRIANVNRVTYVNNNFRRNVNWTTSRSRWGYNPWWYRPRVRTWYASTWNYGWRPSYYRYHYHYGRGYYPPGYARVSVASAVGWGLLGWSLGTLVYDTGYRHYYNPYPVHTTVVYRDRPIDYSRPINTIAVETAPEDDSAVAEITERSESIVERSQEAFREGNYLVALEQVDKAIAIAPGDGALHEYRALIFFALGKYGDAAGVLNPVLASGPGWDWQTMIALYPSQEVYTGQLQRLEEYSESKPDAADAHFLLGYHYMVCGHLDLATPQFDRAVELMPSDSVSKQLASLTRSSSGDTADEEKVPVEPEDKDEGEEEMPAPQPVPLEDLTGVWTSEAGDGGTIKLTFRDDGTFTWTYQPKEGDAREFKGEFSSNDDGLLVLDSEESQMVAEVAMPKDNEMNFMLVGGPPDDPGLDFNKG